MENKNLNTLTDEEKTRAKYCVENIQDKLYSISNELNNSPVAYKPYLKEKLDSIIWDINVLKNMVEGDD